MLHRVIVNNFIHYNNILCTLHFVSFDANKKVHPLTYTFIYFIIFKSQSQVSANLTTHYITIMCQLKKHLSEKNNFIHYIFTSLTY